MSCKQARPLPIDGPRISMHTRFCRHAQAMPNVVQPTTLSMRVNRPSKAEPLTADGVDTAPLEMTSLKAYIVEDSAVIRESLIATLEELGPVAVVGTAEDETTAVRWLTLASNEFDLVIVDLFLKHGSGLGVLKAAHSLRPRRHMVVLSNYATKDMRRKCLELGADRVFDKSNEIDALIHYCAQLASGDISFGD